MKDFSQYASAEEFVQDMVTEGLVPRNRKIRAAYPSVKPPFSRYYVDKLKDKILAAISKASGIRLDGKTKDGRMLSLSNVSRTVRGDNYPAEFREALRQLVAERKISEEKLWSEKSRPTTYYHLYEF
jgi:hypothetical protein